MIYVVTTSDGYVVAFEDEDQADEFAGLSGNLPVREVEPMNEATGADFIADYKEDV